MGCISRLPMRTTHYEYARMIHHDNERWQQAEKRNESYIRSIAVSSNATSLAAHQRARTDLPSSPTSRKPTSKKEPKRHAMIPCTALQPKHSENPHTRIRKIIAWNRTLANRQRPGDPTARNPTPAIPRSHAAPSSPRALTRASRRARRRGAAAAGPGGSGAWRGPWAGAAWGWRRRGWRPT